LLLIELIGAQADLQDGHARALNGMMTGALDPGPHEDADEVVAETICEVEIGLRVEIDLPIGR
jgi:hypothetical protein